MAERLNYLIGRGERLTVSVDKIRSGGKKKPPYDFPTAVDRVRPALERMTEAFDELPDLACPNDEAVAIVTLHPRFISKSDQPARILERVGLRAIGSKAARIIPEQWGVSRHPVEAPTTQLFVAGPRAAFRQWSAEIEGWNEDAATTELTHLEALDPLTASQRVRAIPAQLENVHLELVLHTDRRSSVLEAFQAFALKNDVQLDMGRRRNLGGLCFLPAHADRECIAELARFSFLRIVRGMPTLRPMVIPVVRSGMTQTAVTLPTAPLVDGDARVAVFDGGLPDNVSLPWVKEIDTLGVGPKVSDFTDHGLMVTSALSFGPLTPGQNPPAPFSRIDHYRVLGDDPGTQDHDAYEVLSRIVSVVEGAPHKYAFVNISLGPQMAVEDDDVTLWTAQLDALFARPDILSAVAAGNDGHLDDLAGLNRVQPPSDGVNVLAVGSAASAGAQWSVADYSCVGPGRCPGIMKPDVVGFGGSLGEPFLALGDASHITQTRGTSFSTPSVLRLGVGVDTTLGTDLAPLAIRALLIHQAELGSEGAKRAGWGRVPAELQDVLTCAGDTAHIVYQGALPVGSQLRAEIPTPDGGFRGQVAITATLCIASEVDPEHASTYTRSGLDVVFRPHSLEHSFNNGRKSVYPKSESFFSQGQMYPGEYSLREDGHKWEPVLKASLTKRYSKLHKPVFDIYHNQRDQAGPPAETAEVPYALIVSVSARSMPDLYDRILRAYPQILVPLQPKITIPIRN